MDKASSVFNGVRQLFGAGTPPPDASRATGKLLRSIFNDHPKAGSHPTVVLLLKLLAIVWGKAPTGVLADLAKMIDVARQSYVDGVGGNASDRVI